MAIPFSEAIPRERALAYEPTAKWVRAWLDDRLVVDSKRAIIVWGTDKEVPAYAFPWADVRGELLRETGAATDADLDRMFSLVSRERAEPDAAWTYADDDLRDYVGLRWTALDRWQEEDEEVVGHPRDPYSRVDIRSSTRHVVIEVDGHVVAESRRPTLLFETGLPTRYYLPSRDVRMDWLEPSDHTTVCAYKGLASYFSLVVDGDVRPNLAWVYENPLRDNRQIAGLIAFFNEKVDITVDGRQEERPITQWS